MSFKTFSEIITYISPLMLCIGVSVGIYYYKKLDHVSKLFVYYLVGSLAIDVLSRVLSRITGNNLILYFVLSLLELFIFLKLYHSLSKKKKFVWSLGIFGTAYIVFESIYINAYNLKVFQPYAKVLAPLLIVIMALVYFFELIKDEEKLYKSEADYLSLNSMILCFFALEFLFLLPLNFLINERSELVIYVFIAHIFLLILFYSYLTYFIWKRGRNPKQ